MATRSPTISEETVSPERIVSVAGESNGKGRRKRKDNEEHENPQAANKAARTAETPEDEETIVKLVTKDLYSDDDEVVEEALKRLANFCLDTNENAEENGDAICHAGGHLAIVKILEKQPSTVGVKAEACRCLVNVVVDTDDLYRLNIGKIGGIKAIIAAMKEYPDHSYLQRCGCCAQGNLVNSCKENAEHLEKAGGIAVIVKAMKTHSGVTGLQSEACRSLSILCKREQYKPLIRAAGGASAIGAAFDNHGDDGDIRKYARKALTRLMREAN